jgi:hypothetical protein
VVSDHWTRPSAAPSCSMSDARSPRCSHGLVPGLGSGSGWVLLPGSGDQSAPADQTLHGEVAPAHLAAGLGPLRSPHLAGDLLPAAGPSHYCGGHTLVADSAEQAATLHEDQGA